MTDDKRGEIASLLRADLTGLAPYGAPQLEVPVRLNVNENPYPPDDGLIDDLTTAVAHAARSLNRYPDRDAVELRTELAEFLHEREWVRLSAEQVWAANGSNELMLQLLQAFGGPGRLALTFAPTYSMYPEYCRDTFTEYVAADRLPDFGIDPTAAVHAINEHQPHVVLLASPNNPTGTALDVDTLQAILAAAPGLVVVDEAYAEFRRPGTPTALSLLQANPRLVVTRTMSKAFALAGARVGYLAAAPELVQALQLVRLPYHLSSVTQAVALTALAHADSLLAQVDELRQARDELVPWLHDAGIEVADSDANFVLFGRFPDRHAVWEGLLQRGVLVRETGPDGWLRVSMGTSEEMRAFRRALEEVIA